MHVLCESRHSQRDSLSLSSTALTKHDLQTCCWVSTVGKPIASTEHKHPRFWATLNQRQSQGGPTDVLYWCVAAGGQPGEEVETSPGLCDPLIRTSLTVSQCATVKLVYTVFSYMKGSNRKHFNSNPRTIFSNWPSHRMKDVVSTACYSHECHSICFIPRTIAI